MQPTIEDIRVGFWGDWIILRQENGKLELEHIMTGERRSIADPTWVDAPVEKQEAIPPSPPPWVRKVMESGCAINKMRDYMQEHRFNPINPYPPILPSDGYAIEMRAMLEQYRQHMQDMIRLSPHPPWIVKKEPPPDPPEEPGKNPA